MRRRGRHGTRDRQITLISGAQCLHDRHIVDAAGNRIAQRFYCSLGDRQRRMMAAAVHADRTLVERLISEHAELAAAVARRDATAFDTQLLSHLESTYQVVLR